MEIINEEIYVSLSELSEATGKTQKNLSNQFSRKAAGFDKVEIAYKKTKTGRVVMYRLDSFGADVAASLKALLGIAEIEESDKISVIVDAELQETAQRTLGAQEGAKMARLCAWLRALCPDGRYTKEFINAWEVQGKYYQEEHKNALIYGQLIENAVVFARKAATFKEKGFEALVSRRAGNKNPEKAGEKVQQVLMILAINSFGYLPTVPKLLQKYEQFRAGSLEILKAETGEVLSGFGFPKISNTTVYNVLMNKKNRLILEKHFSSALEFRTKNEPFTFRKPATFSLSKLTMDDKVLRFTFEGGATFWAYLVFDVYSGFLLGFSHVEEDKEKYKLIKASSSASDKKGTQLFKNALLSTFENLQKYGLGKYVPLELETERHIAWNLKDSVMLPGEIFPYTRFCLGGNPQEKKAETFIKRFKYGVEIEYEGFKARPFLKLLQNRLNTDKKNRIYTIEEGKALLDEMVFRYNELPHHLIKAKTKKAMFFEGIEKARLPELPLQNVAKHLGYKAKTSKIHRNQYVFANNETYLLPPASQWFDKVSGKEIEVYLLPYLPEKAFLFEQGEFICNLTLLTEDMRLSEAQGEQTSNNEAALFEEQRNSLQKMAKKGLEELKGFEEIKPWNSEETEEEAEKVVPTKRSNKFFKM